MAIERYAIFNDVHFPYEDKSRYAVALKILTDTKPDHIYFNGDIAEFQGVSAWPIHPTERMDFCQELNYLNKKFDEIMEMFPGIPVTYLVGNHEHRLFRYIQSMAPAMFGTIDCPLVLQFDQRPNWRLIDYGPAQLAQCGKSNLYLRHEPLGGGQNPAKLTAEASYIDIATGHVHKYCTYSHKKFGPKPIQNTAYCLGWLGDPSRHVFDYRGGKDAWVRGFTIIECETKTGAYTLDFINLEKLPAFYRSKEYKVK